MVVRQKDLKSLRIQPSGRSSDFISPSFGFGCLLDCAYCYMKRHKPVGLDINKNIDTILTEINNHAWFSTVDKPNQTHEKYITYDISCNEDFALHAKYHDWRRIFDFFRDHDIAFGTLATKIIPEAFLDYDPKSKIRIRFSLMPQFYSSIMEPNTPPIIDRIKAIDGFIDAGYDVHINFSPVIVHNGWRKFYKELFHMVNDYVDNKDTVKAEVIFLTHNEKKHRRNMLTNPRAEDFLWKPMIMEKKTSQTGSKNLRYQHELKRVFINQFKTIHSEIIPWNTIRYIF